MAYELNDQDRELARQMGLQQFQAEQQQLQAVKQKGNLFTNSLSTAGGILGGIGGSFFGPGIGTAAGGALGAGAGKFLENLLEGNDAGEGVLGEAALGTLGGIGKGFKAIKGATGALRAGESGKDALSILRSGVPSARPGVAGTPGILNKISTSAKELDAKTSGLGVGQKLNGQMITPDRSQSLYDFARSRGVSSGSPMAQSKQAESLLRDTTKSLDDTLSTINRPVTADELSTLSKTATSKVADNAAVTGATKTLGKFSEKISKAKDLKELEAIRREADDLAYSATGAKKTSAAAQAKAVRETIDDYVSGISKEYKAVKGDYRNAKDILELKSRQVNSGKGGLDIFGNKVGSSAIPSLISKGSNLVARATGGGVPPTSVADDVLRQASSGAGGEMPTIPIEQMLGKAGIGNALKSSREAATRQASDAVRQNDLSKQFIENLARERATQGQLIPGGGIMLQPGKVPSFATEGIEKLKVPSIPSIPDRYSGLSLDRPTAAGILSGMPPVASPAAPQGGRWSGIPNSAKIAGMQLGGRAVTGNLPGQANGGRVDAASVLGGVDPVTGQPTGQGVMGTDPTTGMPTGSTGSGTPGSESQSMYSRENAAMDIQNDLQTTGGANMDKYLKLYEFMNPEPAGGTQKPLSAEASKVLANANSGLDSLSQLGGMIDKGGVQLGTVLPGRDLLGGLGANILGTGGYDTAAKNVTDVITRLRTGAALTDSEEKFYKSQLPQAFDSPEVQAQKMKMFQDLFSSIANRTGSSGTDAQAMLQGAF